MPLTAAPWIGPAGQAARTIRVLPSPVGEVPAELQRIRGASPPMRAAHREESLRPIPPDPTSEGRPTPDARPQPPTLDPNPRKPPMADTLSTPVTRIALSPHPVWLGYSADRTMAGRWCARVVLLGGGRGLVGARRLRAERADGLGLGVDDKVAVAHRAVIGTLEDPVEDDAAAARWRRLTRSPCRNPGRAGPPGWPSATPPTPRAWSPPQQDRSPFRLRPPTRARSLRGQQPAHYLRFRSAYICLAASPDHQNRRAANPAPDHHQGLTAAATPASRPFVLATPRALRLDPGARRLLKAGHRRRTRPRSRPPTTPIDKAVPHQLTFEIAVSVGVGARSVAQRPPRTFV